ncbi:MAG: 30S ribosomal protein S9 [Candidatus Moranbacteria bacterium]|jgi:small subunit ribosomal protein S9|nr:30S ribosomal protein S9 [Candidatus Moranbacteria bacterium]
MATKETTETTETEVKPKKVTKKKVAAKVAPKAAKEAARYLYAVGRRKTAVAQVRLYPVDAPEEAVVNGKSILAYFGTPALVAQALSPLKTTGLESTFTITVVVRGGGLHGQADAIKLGIARSLVKHDLLLRATLKARGMMTRDARAVERKKPGLKKARRAPQWSKR